jgi:hypothetical protein
LKTTLNEIDYIINFVDSIGVSSDKERELAEVLFKSIKCCEKFYIGFLSRNSHMIDDLLDYREYKLSIANITVDKFITLCDNKVNREIFETTFLQKIDSNDVVLIEKAILQGKASLHTIFNNFQKNPNKNILKYVL